MEKVSTQQDFLQSTVVGIGGLAGCMRRPEYGLFGAAGRAKVLEQGDPVLAAKVDKLDVFHSAVKVDPWKRFPQCLKELKYPPVK